MAQYKATKSRNRNPSPRPAAFSPVEYARELAREGKPQGMYFLGNAYAKGCGVSMDRAEAMRWYTRAAAKGHARAMFNAGHMCENGHLGPPDTAEAVRWYERAAEGGFAGAMDAAAALQWYLQAAEEGDAGAMRDVAEAYAAGKGVPKDAAAAAHWRARAAAADTGPPPPRSTKTPPQGDTSRPCLRWETRTQPERAWKRTASSRRSGTKRPPQRDTPPPCTPSPSPTKTERACPPTTQSHCTRVHGRRGGRAHACSRGHPARHYARCRRCRHRRAMKMNNPCRVAALTRQSGQCSIALGRQCSPHTGCVVTVHPPTSKPLGPNPNRALAQRCDV